MLVFPSVSPNSRRLRERSFGPTDGGEKGGAADVVLTIIDPESLNESMYQLNL